MKMNKTKVFALALAVCMIAILSMGSLAWFTDTDDVTNDFMIAGSGMGGDSVFSVTVWEQKDENGDGDFDDTDDVNYTEDGLSYSDILPGDALSKVAHVTNTGSYDQYIRVTVTINEAEIWANCLGSDFNDATLLGIFGGFDMASWSNITTAVDTVNDKIVIVMYYNDILAVDGDFVVFDTVNVPAQLTPDQADAMGANGFSISVVADAVQTMNLGIDLTDGICDAYQAFAVVEA